MQIKTFDQYFLVTVSKHAFFSFFLFFFSFIGVSCFVVFSGFEKIRLNQEKIQEKLSIIEANQAQIKILANSTVTSASSESVLPSGYFFMGLFIGIIIIVLLTKANGLGGSGADRIDVQTIPKYIIPKVDPDCDNRFSELAEPVSTEYMNAWLDFRAIPSEVNSRGIELLAKVYHAHDNTYVDLGLAIADNPKVDLLADGLLKILQ